jgi:hypothetical protein
MASRVKSVIEMETPLQVVALNRTLTALASNVPAIETAMNRVRAIAGTFDMTVEAAEQNALLSAAGKGERVNAAAIAARAALDDFTATVIGPYETRAAAVAAKLTTAKPAQDVVSLLKAQELRRPYAQLDSMQRAAIYSSLPASDPAFDELRQALETGPMTLDHTPGQLPAVVPFVPVSVVEAATAARAESQNPAAAAELHDLKLIVRTLKSLCASCRRGVAEVAGPADVPATTV